MIRQVASVKRRVRTHLAEGLAKIGTPPAREAHLEAKSSKTPHGRSTFGRCNFKNWHAACARSTNQCHCFFTHPAGLFLSPTLRCPVSTWSFVLCLFTATEQYVLASCGQGEGIMPMPKCTELAPVCRANRYVHFELGPSRS